MAVIAVVEFILIVAIVYTVISGLQSIGLAEIYDGRYVLCMDRVNIRLGASSKSDAIGWLEPGDVVYPDGKKKNGYYHCEIPSIEAGEGWVFGGYLVDDKPERAWCKGVVTGNGKVQARKYVKGKRTRWLKPGGVMKVYWVSDEWCITDCGYVMTDFIELVGE